MRISLFEWSANVEEVVRSDKRFHCLPQVNRFANLLQFILMDFETVVVILSPALLTVLVKFKCSRKIYMEIIFNLIVSVIFSYGSGAP